MMTEKEVNVSDSEAVAPSQKNDIVQKVIGAIGKYQICLCLLIFLTKFPVAFHQMAIIFMAPPVSYNCTNTNATTCPCEEPAYDTSIFTNSIIMSWHLICEKAWLKDITQTFFQLGTLIGSVVFGSLSDRYGRRKPLIAAVVLQIVAGVAASLVNEFWTFTLLRFFVGASVGGVMVVGFVICMEFVGSEYRATASALYQIPFNLGHLLLPAFGYLFRNWSSLQLALSLPSLVLLSYWWLVPESPRWLLAVRETDAAIRVLERAATVNKLPTEKIRAEAEDHQLSLAQQDSAAAATVLDLFRTPRIRRNIIGMAVNWLACSYCFYGVSQYIGQLSGNIFTNVAASAAVTIPGTLISIPLMKTMGRKTLIVSSHIVCSVCLLAIAVTPVSFVWLQVSLACVGVVTSFIVFVLVYLYCSELFPTVVRNNAMGICSMTARIGSMVAPFVATLNYQARWLPPLLFGIVPIVGALFCLSLPETKGCQLMTTLEEGENFGSKKSKDTSIGLENRGADLRP